MVFDAGEIRASLAVSRDQFTRDLDAAKADADKFTKDPIKATITGNRDELTRELRQARADGDEWARKTYEAKIGADGKQARDTFDSLLARKDALTKDPATIKVKVDGAAAANTELDKVGLKADALGRKTETVKVKTETDTSGIDGLSKKVSELTSGPFSLLKTAIVGLGPATIPVLGAVTAAILPLGAAIGSAATGLGAFGLIAKEVLTQAGTASTAASTAQTAYTTAVQKTTGQYQAAMDIAKTQAQRNSAYAAEQKGFASARLTETAALSKAYSGMSAQQIALSQQVGNLQTAWKGVLTSVTPLMSSALVPWMKDVQQLLQYIKPLITPIAALFKTWGDELGRALAGNQAGITRFIDSFAARSAANIRSFGTALMEFAKGAGSLLHDVDPYLAGAAGGIAGLATSFAGWAKSKQTADDIKGFFAWAKAEAPAVKKFLEELAISVGHLIQAMAYSGGGDLKVLTIALDQIAKLPPAAIVAIADGYVAISVGLRAMAAATALYAIAAKDAAGYTLLMRVQLGLMAIQEKAVAIWTGLVTAATVLADAAETVYIALMIIADAVSLPLVVVVGGIVLAVAALAFGIYELATHWGTVWHSILAVTRVVWDGIKGAVSGAVKWITGIFGDIAGPAIREFDKIKTFVTGSFDSWWRTNGATVKQIWHDLWAAVGAVFRSIWDPLVADAKIGWAVLRTVFSAGATILTAAWRGLWTGMEALFKIAWSGVIVPLVRTGWAVITGIFTVSAAVIGAIWRAVWAAILATVKIAWAAIQAVVRIAWDVLVGLFTVGIDVVTGKWGKAWAEMKLVTTQVFNSILSFFGTFWGALQTGFGAAVSGVAAAWGKIEQVVKTPVNWVISNVYDALIMPFWNATAGAVGLPKLPKLAGGGIVPGGYSPVDNQLAWLRSGEGVLQPGAVAALGGPAFIHAANRAYGDVPVSSGGHYAAGGIVPNLHPGANGVPVAGNPPSGPGPLGKAVSAVAHGIGSILSDVASGVFDSLASAGTGLIGGAAKLIPGTSGVADAMREYPAKIWQGFLSWVTAHAPSAATGSGADVVAYARSFLGKIPYTWGGTSASGADCSGFVDLIYQHFGIHPPRSSEAQGAWVKKGPPASGGLAFYHSPPGGPDPGHVAIVQSANSVISQGGGMGPTMMALHGMPLLFTGSPPSGFGGGNSVPAKGGSALAAQNYARSLLSQYHWGADQMSPLIALWNQESGWNDNAVNPSSGAYGIPQALGKGHPYNLGDYANQVIWGLNYIRDRYGSPSAAEQHEVSAGWYDQGGWLQPGTTLAVNNTGRPELVISGDQLDALSKNGPSGRAGGQLAGTINIMLPEGGTVADAFSELTFRLRAAQQQSWTGGNPYG